MALRSSEMSLRNELVRYQLDDAIRAPAGGQHQEKNGCSSRLMIDPRFMVGIIVVTWCLRTYIGFRPYMVKVYIKEQINDQTTICAGGVTGNTTYLGV